MTGRSSEKIARRFHEIYEGLAFQYDYETRPESAVPWDDVPENNRKLMVAVVSLLLSEGTIALPRYGERYRERSP